VIGPPHGRDVVPFDPAVVQRRSYQHAVEPGIGKALELARRADAAARQELHLGKRVPQGLHQHQVHAAPAAYAREIEHDDRPGASGDGRPRELERRLGEGGPRQGCAVPQIERENDARPEGSNNRRECVERWQGLEADHHPRGTVRHELARPLGARDRGIYEHPAAQAYERLHHSMLDRTPREGVEIGDVPLVAIEEVAVGAPQGDRIALRAAVQEPRAHRRIRLAPATARQDRPAAAQVEHGDHPQ